MDKWVKLKDKLPNNGLYAVRDGTLPITTVKVTNDNMVHLIQKTAMSDKQYCISIELNDILPMAARMDNNAILMLIRGFIMQRNQWDDIVSIIFKYFCCLA